MGKADLGPVRYLATLLAAASETALRWFVLVVPIGRIFASNSRREACARNSPWGSAMARPENERSPTTLAHKSSLAQRMADFFEDRITDPVIQGGMAQLILAGARRNGAQARAWRSHDRAAPKKRQHSTKLDWEKYDLDVRA
jgi:hypothetical protein